MKNGSPASPWRNRARFGGMILVSLALCLATFAFVLFVECKISG